MTSFLFKRVDNTALSLWRIALGFLLAAEGFGAIATGWVKKVMVEPAFTFNFIGFDFLQPLPGNGMYYYYALMGIFGLLIMVGYKYRWSMAAYALMWMCVYLMQKSAYNNHYYLMMLLCWIMVFFPANRYLSIDAKKEGFKKYHMPQWVSVVFIFHIWIVFTYAAIAKIYPQWLDGSVPALFMKAKANYWLIGDWLQQQWVHYGIAYFGIAFDLFIIPMFLWKKTRKIAFGLSLFFHLFNSAVFQVGIFPYMSIAFSLFFFQPKTLIQLFKLKRPVYNEVKYQYPSLKNWGIAFFSIYFIIQLLLPLRHWVIKGPVLWTEEGHRLSWRMMLRTRSGQLVFWVKDKSTGEKKIYPYRQLVSSKQINSLKTKPDFMWQMAQRIKKMEAAQGRDVGVYVTSNIKINEGGYYPFIDPEVDLAAVKWKPFKHHEWILPPPENFAHPK